MFRFENFENVISNYHLNNINWQAAAGQSVSSPAISNLLSKMSNFETYAQKIRDAKPTLDNDQKA